MRNTNDVHEVLAQLRKAGEHPDLALLDRVKALGPAAVSPLIEMATDESLHGAETESPEMWAPLHALEILGALEAAEAVEPLLPLLASDDEWLHESDEHRRQSHASGRNGCIRQLDRSIEREPMHRHNHTDARVGRQQSS